MVPSAGTLSCCPSRVGGPSGPSGHGTGDFVVVARVVEVRDADVPVGDPGSVPYPDKVLGDDEEVVRHLHPHWLTIFWRIVLFLVLVGAASFGAALVPAGAQQGLFRLA